MAARASGFTKIFLEKHARNPSQTAKNSISGVLWLIWPKFPVGAGNPGLRPKTPRNVVLTGIMWFFWGFPSLCAVSVGHAPGYLPRGGPRNGVHRVMVVFGGFTTY